MARLDRLTSALGEERFGAVLFETMQAVADAAHCFVFAFDRRGTPRCLVSAGEGGRAAEAFCSRYVDGLFTSDPNCDAVVAYRNDKAPLTFAPFAPDSHRALFGEAGFNDVMALAVSDGEVAHYLILARRQGLFVESQRWLVTQIASIIGAHVRKHASFQRAGFGHRNVFIENVLCESKAFVALTEREKAVCFGILTGHTSEGIALNLKISINSVLTYRKRLYEKLRISSQNELFCLVMNAAQSASNGGQAEGDQARQLSDRSIGAFWESAARPVPSRPAA
jgi:DNA-binding CsgD family transcriptional regulator